MRGMHVPCACCLAARAPCMQWVDDEATAVRAGAIGRPAGLSSLDRSISGILTSPTRAVVWCACRNPIERSRFAWVGSLARATHACKQVAVKKEKCHPPFMETASAHTIYAWFNPSVLKDSTERLLEPNNKSSKRLTLILLTN